MDVKDKILGALTGNLEVHFARLEDDDGITGFIVSPQFRDVSSLDRQVMIEDALNTAMNPITPEEHRQVLMIAGVTPEEYESVGARIRVDEVSETPGGGVEIRLHGGPSDAAYVRGALNNQEGVETTEPRQVTGAIGILMSFQAKGSESNPLTRARAIRVLKDDRYIEVLANA